MKRALLLALLAACGPASSDGPDGGGGGGGGLGGNTGTQLDIYKSGSRIKMNVLTTADGAKSFQGWHDSQLDVDCTFQPADDGSTRCLPTSISYAADSLFSDAQCTKPVVVASCSGSLAGQFATLGAYSTSCPAQYRYTAYKITGTASAVFTKSSGSCMPTTINPSFATYTLGPALPASMFVQATASAE